MVSKLSDNQYCRFLRKRYNIKLKTVAGIIRCSVSVLSKWEKGEMDLFKDKIKFYIKFLNEYKFNV